MSNIKWYNDIFEICDFNTKKKSLGQCHSQFLKMNLPDSPLLNFLFFRLSRREI